MRACTLLKSMAYANIRDQDTGTYEFRSFHFADAGDQKWS